MVLKFTKNFKTETLSYQKQKGKAKKKKTGHLQHLYISIISQYFSGRPKFFLYSKTQHSDTCCRVYLHLHNIAQCNP